MGQISINPNKTWQVNNIDDYNGNLTDTIGISLDSKKPLDGSRGDLIKGGKLYIHTSQVNVTSITTVPQGMIYSDADGAGSFYWFNTPGGLYKNASLTDSNGATGHFAKDTNTSTPAATKGDMIAFGRPSSKDRLLVAISNDILKLNNSTTWSSFWKTDLSQADLNAVDHPLAVFAQPFMLVIGDKNLLHTIDQNLNVKNSRLVLQPNHQIDWIEVTDTRIYLGVEDTINKTAGGVYEYDPINEVATFFPYDTPGVGAGVGYIDSDQLFLIAPDLRLKQFNGKGFSLIAETPFSKKSATLGTAGLLHRNGIIVQDSKVLFNFGSNQVGLPSGLYVFDKLLQQFYHKYVITLNYKSDSFQYCMGAPGFLYSNGSVIVAGVQEVNANIVGIATDQNTFSITDIVMWSFTTVKVLSQDIKNIWKKIWTKYQLYDSDTIILKFRYLMFKNGTLPLGAKIGASWTSSTTFTLSASSASRADLLLIAVGQEVMILDGLSAGYTAHITAVSTSGSPVSTVTVTIDESIGTNGESSDVCITPFQKVAIISDVNVQSIGENIPMTVDSEWLQLKIQARGSSPVFNDFLLETQGSKKISAPPPPVVAPPIQ